jgi:hypothetical protein
MPLEWLSNVLKLEAFGTNDEAFKSGWIIESRD